MKLQRYHSIVLFVLWGMGVADTLTFRPKLRTAFVRSPLQQPTTTSDTSELQDIHDYGDIVEIDNLREEYNRKRAKAELAMAAADDARQKLEESSLSTRRPFIATRAKISKSDAGTLIIEVPPTGLNTSSVFSGAFSIAWFSAVLPATFAGLWLFMIPFWAAGALVAKHAVVDPFVSSKLTIGQYAWSLKSIYGGAKGIKLNEQEGASEELRGARPELVAVVNDVPQYELKLYGTKGAISLYMGSQVSQEELQYLADEINGYLWDGRDFMLKDPHDFSDAPPSIGFVKELDPNDSL